MVATAASAIGGRHRGRPDRRLRRRGHHQHAAGPRRGRRRARARRQPQAVPQRRGARGQEARPHAGLRPRAAGRHRHRAAALLALRAGPAGRRGRDVQGRSHLAAARSSTTPRPSAPTATAPGRRRRALLHAAQRQRRLRRPRSTGRRRRSTPCCTATPRTRSSTSSTTAGSNTPMPAWGAPGGGPLTEQQLDNVIAYLYSIQLSSDDSQTALQNEIETVCKPDDAEPLHARTAPPTRPSGQTARRGPVQPGPVRRLRRPAPTPAPAATPRAGRTASPRSPAAAALGPNLTDGSPLRQFETAAAAGRVRHHGLRARQADRLGRHRLGPDARLRAQPQRRSTRPRPRSPG